MKNVIKKASLLTSIMLLFAFTSNAQINKKKKANKDTENWRYEIECVGIGKPGTKVIKVWSYSKKATIAINQAKKNAVHGIIFQGYAGGAQGCTNQRPLTNDPALEQQKEEFFEDFFKDNGKYMKFVSTSGDGTPTTMKVGKEYKIGVVVTVMVDLLRKDLEAAGIIKGLSSGF
ncbi:MAG: hypothetical protein OQJ96_11280 [Flavobacteriales bacterium]|jgi:hypothetical protein|nr:hypothetical protein [Flavobacteriales bacterium]MCW8912538.1 hypothetical protein [Flavobacteriales bacterium]MCW8937552.1 hypothetical protein [Flavobacteriales bacterium]MCW8941420.1 hypothetical protein [Flavobacteriales bacterium]MCW8968536.1 hypothetical protein [Flavobacteriales bacterium]